MNRATRLLLALVAVCACSDVTTNFSTGALKAGGGAATGASDAAAMDAANATKDAAAQRPSDASTADAARANSPVLCGDHVCACDDGKDNDADALVDGFDPECTGPYDDDEATFATGAPAGANRCHDCFWDNNAGPGDDGCLYPEECLSNPSFKGKGNCQSCEVSQTCVDRCGVRAPNGCDCFGCCEITRRDGTSILISLTDSCSLARLDDTSACPRCVQNTACGNPCGRCELCPGRLPQDLPSDCGTAPNESGPRYVCDEGQPVCSETQACPPGAYCQLGCCLYVVF